MIKIALVANSGGHLNQLLQLHAFYKQHAFFFITNETACSAALAAKEKVHFVDNFILKQLLRSWSLGPIDNLVQSYRILRKENPDLVVTTGAGVAFGSCLAAKLLGKKLVFIESIARVYHPSTFGRLVHRWADLVLVQWKHLTSHYKGAHYAGLVFDISEPKPFESDRPVFVTTGTYPLQFNRLLKKLDELKAAPLRNLDIIAQVGNSDYRPCRYSYFDYRTQQDIHRLITESRFVISHGGSGSIMDALVRGKRVIAVPRSTRYDEFFDDHQLQLVTKLEEQGLILAVYDIEDLLDTIKRIEEFMPRVDKQQQGNHIALLNDFLGQQFK